MARKTQLATFSTDVAERIQQHSENYQDVIGNIEYYLNLPYEDENALDEDTASELAEQAEADYVARVALELGVDPEDLYEDEDEDEDDEADYAASNALATFSAGNAFGAALLELAQEEFEDPIEGLAYAADIAKLNDEQIIGLITGEYVPTEELAARLAEAFESTADENVWNGFMISAAEAVEEAALDEDEDYEDDEEDGEPDAAYSALANEYENLRAEFSAKEIESAVKDTLNEIEILCNEGIQNRWLPPAAKQIILASFKSENDRIAAFSQMCEANGVDVETQLFAMNYALEIFSRCGDYGMFSQFSEIPMSNEEADFSQASDEVVNSIVENLYKNGLRLPDPNK